MNFEMTREEASDLARYIERIRKRLPGDTWHKPGIEDALARARQRATSPDLARAAIRAAENPLNRTPAIIGMDGPHWKEATVQPRPEVVPNTERCSICSLPQNACRLRWQHDHEFDSLAEAKRRKAAGTPEATTTVIAALKDEIAATPRREPAMAGGLEALADRDPRLKARVDAVREHLPEGPPMREPEAPQPEPAADEGGAA